MRSCLLLALIASACSFSNTNQLKCTENADCVSAFGAGAVCQSDGFCTGGTAGGDAGADGNGSGSSAVWTFVSFPDFLNADIGDISSLTTAVNSTNAAHEAAIAAVLDAMAAEKPDFAMVAGDLVNGHWYQDASNLQVFGPVGTLAEKRAAVTTASDIYYAQWKQRFTSRGIPVYAAVGDHDVGDNNWPAGQDKSFLVPTYKQQWAKYFTLDANGSPLFASRPTGTPFENTAYAVRHKNLLVVTVDVFRQDDPAVAIDSKTGSVRTDVVGDQLAWLDSVLLSASTDPQIDHVIVQGHVPVLLPVRVLNSSGMTMPGSGDSEFWQTLSRNKVDAYFAGEVHDMSAANYAGVEQVVHGGIMGYAPRVSYLVGHVYPDRVELEMKSAELVYPLDDTTRLWQAGSNRPRAQYSISPNGFSSAGKLVIDKSGGSTQYLDRSGFFIPMGGGVGMAVHLAFDEASGTTTTNHGSTGAANNGTLEGATYVPGKIGNAVSFDNVDRVLAGAPPVTGAQPRTTSTWIRVASSSAVRTVFSFGSNTGGGKWDTDVDATGLYELGVGQGRTDATGSPALADNAWHHVVTVLPQGATTLGDVKMYVDGNPITFTAPATPIDTKTGNIIIGQSVNAQATQQFSGSVDDFAIWSKDLDAGQVRALYSFGNDATLNYDASEVETIFDGFTAHQDVMISGRLWRYQASGLTGTPGQLVASSNTYSVNLGGGAGFVSP
jgi:3',5'-cyclic AMP phosphodiesterase CpdA